MIILEEMCALTARRQVRRSRKGRFHVAGLPELHPVFVDVAQVKAEDSGLVFYSFFLFINHLLGVFIIVVQHLHRLSIVDAEQKEIFI